MNNNFRYDPHNDVYLDESGREHIKNEFDPLNPTFIDISSQVWTGVRNAKSNSVNWSKFKCLPENMISGPKTILRNKLKLHSFFYITRYRLALEYINQWQSRKKWSSWGDITLSDWHEIWNDASPDNRSTLREIYGTLAQQRNDNAKLSISNELFRWRSRYNIVNLKAVRTWDSKTGSLTTSEMVLLSNGIKARKDNESSKHMAIRLSIWCIIETFKRSSQITGMSKNALKEVGGQFFLEIPGAKAQVGSVKLWPISNELAEMIECFSARPDVFELQKAHDKLIVFDCQSLRQFGQIQTAILKSKMQGYIKSLCIVSPRTGKKLNVTGNRLRHTGATKLAEYGFPRDVIADILEHDSYGSADAYIDAIGSDLIPAVERADRQLGKLFSEISDAFFKGKIVDAKEATKLPPIIIPIIEDSPAIVGSCGRDTITEGKCSRHPFMGCYDNCPSFLAWKEADHHKSLKYIENEYERWDSAGGHQERWKARSEFERVYQAVNDIIQQIENQNE